MENMYIFAVFKNEKKYEYEYLGFITNGRSRNCRRKQESLRVKVS